MSYKLQKLDQCYNNKPRFIIIYFIITLDSVCVSLWPVRKEHFPNPDLALNSQRYIWMSHQHD